ncbi:MAG: hypothetical protein L0027_05260 [Candidatus Rokubacteria bacterium]|nr:hypothetical protein [Candidatus Rokubacteria bacterium]
MLLAIPEDVLVRLIDPEQLVTADDAEIDTALTNQIDVAASELAQALAETGRSLAHLHALRTAAEGLAYRKGYRTGALGTGWAVHGMARDLGRKARSAE